MKNFKTFLLEAEQLNELNVVQALLQGRPIRAAQAFASNVRRRGLLGSLPLGDKSTRRAVDSTIAKTETLRYKADEERAKAEPQEKEIRSNKERRSLILRGVHRRGDAEFVPDRSLPGDFFHGGDWRFNLKPEESAEINTMEKQNRNIEKEIAPIYGKAWRMEKSADKARHRARQIEIDKTWHPSGG